MSDLEKRTLVELRKMAKELGIPAISGLKKKELIEKIEQSSEVQKNDSVPRSAASDFSHRNFDEKTEAPQEHTEREKQFFEELGGGDSGGTAGWIWVSACGKLPARRK